MRRSRRGGNTGPEFGGSGEDSFVAVVVTKLTGALLFILLLTMVIMALLPKAVDMAPASADRSAAEPATLAITTPESLPEAIAGRPYVVALAASGGRGRLRWSVDGALPEGLAFDAASARIEGTPRAGTPEPVNLLVQASDGTARAAQPTRLSVLQPDRPLSTPSRWRPGLPPIPWSAWLEQGVGFLLLLLVHFLGMNAVGALERRSLAVAGRDLEPETLRRSTRRRFAVYRLTVRLASLAATGTLAVWLWRRHV
jgi:hypothetical protein